MKLERPIQFIACALLVSAGLGKSLLGLFGASGSSNAALCLGFGLIYGAPLADSFVAFVRTRIIPAVQAGIGAAR